MTTQPEGHLPLHDGSELFDELLDTEGLLFEEGVWSEPERVPSGSGLPRGFALRHDRHYVDELLSASELRQVIRLRPQEIDAPKPVRSIPKELSDSISSFGVLQPILVRRRGGRYELVAGAKRLAAARACALAHVPCLLHDVDDDAVESIRDATNLHSDESADFLAKVMPMIGQSLHSILSCVQLASSENSTPQDHGVKKLIHAEATQAAQLSWCASLLSVTPGLNLTVFDAAQVLDNVLIGSEKDPNLTGLTLERYIDRPCKVKADRRLLSLAMVSARSAVVPLARAGGVGAVTVHLALRPKTNMIEYGLSLKTETPFDFQSEAWLDLRWKERPGGLRAGVELLASKRVAELHGGSFSIAGDGNRRSFVMRVPMS